MSTLNAMDPASPHLASRSTISTTINGVAKRSHWYPVFEESGKKTLATICMLYRPYFLPGIIRLLTTDVFKRLCKASSSLLKPLSVFLLRVARTSLFIPSLALYIGGKHVVSWRVEIDWFGVRDSGKQNPIREVTPYIDLVIYTLYHAHSPYARASPSRSCPTTLNIQPVF